jgi:broad specificity phosphatase PhoE
MTFFWLIRHGSTDALDRNLSGRMPGVHLNEQGQREVAALTERVAREAQAARERQSPIAPVFASPIERALTTARPLADRLGCELTTLDALAEIDFGRWTGKHFEELHGDAHWERFNRFRCGTPIPGGESMLDVSARAVHALLRLRDEHPDRTLLLVSHGDVIKASVMHFLGIPFDFCNRLALAPASITTLEVDADGARLHAWNDTGHLTSAR